MKYRLAIASVFRDETPYLKEWIEFHLLAGVEHFYLFDNLSQDHPQTLLEPYIAQGIVELSIWPLSSMLLREFVVVQSLAFERAVLKAEGESQWLALLDCDEFLFPVQEQSLVETLREFEPFGGVAVNWQVFGTGGVEKAQSIVRELLLKAPAASETNRHVKSIVQPRCVASCPNAHSMIYKEGYFQVDTNKRRFEGPFSPEVLLDKLRINHYSLRDSHFFRMRKEKLLQQWQVVYNPSTYYEGLNQVEDREILRYLRRLSPLL